MKMILHVCDYLVERNNVRVKLNKDFCKLIYNKLRLKFNSIAEYNKIRNLAKTYDSLYDWLRNDKSIRLKHIIQIIKDVGILHEELHKNIIGFTSQGSKFILKIPYFVEVTEELTEFYGMYVGDGETSKKSQSLSFGNTSEIMLRKFLNFVIKVFDINLSDFSICIQVPYSLYNENEIKLKWAKTLDIKSENIKSIYYTPEIKIYGRINKRNKEYCRIRLNRSIVKWFFDNIHNILKNYIMNDKKLYIGYLRGIFAAEGCCSFDSKYKRVITINMRSNKEMKFISNILLLLGVQNKVKWRMKDGSKMYFINIYNKQSFEKLFEIDLFNLHEEKKIDFENLIISYKKEHFLSTENHNKEFNKFDLVIK
jgi:hypothetical protein